MRVPSGSTDRVIYFVAVDSTDLKTRETGLASFTVYRSRNGGGATLYTTPTVTEISSANMPGVYSLLIDEDTTIGATHDTESYLVHITQASMAPVSREIELYRPETTEGNTLVVDASGIGDADIRQLLGSAVATPTVSGVFEVDLTHVNGTAATSTAGRPEVNTTHVGGTSQTAGDIPARLPAALVSGRMDCSVGAMAANTITNTAIATGAIDADALAADTITNAKIADGSIDAATFATNAITSSIIAPNAIGSSQLDAGAVTEIADGVKTALGIVTGTADSGTTTTMVDAARTESDTDYWKGSLIVFTGGSISNIARLITGFTPGTDTITFTPALPASVGTNTYIIVPMGRVDVELWDGSVVNALVSGAVDVSVGAMSAAGLADFFDTNSGTTYASAVAGSVVKEIADNAGGAAPDYLVAGTSDSGSTTTMVDAARTEADADYWKGAYILFTSGNISGQCRLITAFNAAADTITFAPATTQAVATQTYEIHRNARVDIDQWLGTTVATPTVAGVPEVDVTHFGGSAGTFTAGLPSVQDVLGDVSGSVGSVLGNVDGSVGSVVGSVGGSVASVTGNVGGNLVGNVQGNVNGSVASVVADVTLGAGAITSTTFDSNAITSAAIDQSTIRALRSLFASTADSGTTTTLVDTALAYPDTDQIKGCWLLFTSGTLDGQVRLITAFNPATDTATFAPPTTQAVSTHTYEILPAAAVDVAMWDGDVVASLIAGRVDVSVGAMAAGTVTATAIATGAIDADAIASDAVTEIQTGLATSAALATVQADTDNIQTRLPAALVGGRMDSSVGALATGVLTAAAAAADYANLLADHFLRRTYANARASADGDTLNKRSLLGAIAKAVNRVAISAGTLTIYNEDDTTSTAPGGTQTLTTDAAAEPIIEQDP